MKRDNCLLKNFVTLSENEKLMVLRWRNHDNIRLWMHNTSVIGIAEHLNFINTLENDMANIYFLVVESAKNIGVVYFNYINYEQRECEFGLYVNPFEKIIGVGKILIEICIQYVFNVLEFKKIKLEVFSNNVKAIKLYQKYNFVQTSTKSIDDKKIICMELKNENR